MSGTYCFPLNVPLPMARPMQSVQCSAVMMCLASGRSSTVRGRSSIQGRTSRTEPGGHTTEAGLQSMHRPSVWANGRCLAGVSSEVLRLDPAVPESSTVSPAGFRPSIHRFRMERSACLNHPFDGTEVPTSFRGSSSRTSCGQTKDGQGHLGPRCHLARGILQSRSAFA
jgi:hypothetical protein